MKGAGLLGFAGLMLACDYVFLSSAEKTFLAPAAMWDVVGFAGVLALTGGAFFALASILVSESHRFKGEGALMLRKSSCSRLCDFTKSEDGGSIAVAGWLSSVL